MITRQAVVIIRQSVVITRQATMMTKQTSDLSDTRQTVMITRQILQYRQPGNADNRTNFFSQLFWNRKSAYMYFLKQENPHPSNEHQEKLREEARHNFIVVVKFFKLFLLFHRGFCMLSFSRDCKRMFSKTGSYVWGLPLFC